MSQFTSFHYYDGVEVATKLRVPNLDYAKAASIKLDTSNFSLGTFREINMLATYRI